MSTLLQITALILATTVGPRALPPSLTPAATANTVAAGGAVTVASEPTVETASSHGSISVDTGEDTDRQAGSRPRGGRRRPLPLTVRRDGAAISSFSPPAGKAAGIEAPGVAPPAVLVVTSPDRDPPRRV